MWPYPKHLRTTAPFLVSARPLSFEWRGRDLASFDAELLQPAGDLVVDVLRAVVGVEAADREGEAF